MNWIILGLIFVYLIMGVAFFFVYIALESGRVTLRDMIESWIGILIWPFAALVFLMAYFYTEEIVLLEKKSKDKNDLPG